MNGQNHAWHSVLLHVCQFSLDLIHHDAIWRNLRSNSVNCFLKLLGLAIGWNGNGGPRWRRVQEIELLEACHGMSGELQETRFVRLKCLGFSTVKSSQLMLILRAAAGATLRSKNCKAIDKDNWSELSKHWWQRYQSFPTFSYNIRWGTLAVTRDQQS